MRREVTAVIMTVVKIHVDAASAADAEEKVRGFSPRDVVNQGEVTEEWIEEAGCDA